MDALLSREVRSESYRVWRAERVELWPNHGRGRPQSVYERAHLGEPDGLGAGQLYADH